MVIRRTRQAGSSTTRGNAIDYQTLCCRPDEQVHLKVNRAEIANLPKNQTQAHPLSFSSPLKHLGCERSHKWMRRLDDTPATGQSEMIPS